MTQVWKLLDSRNFMLPQRRTRVWGIACLNSGSGSREEVLEKFVGCIDSMQTNIRFAENLYFADLERQPPRKGHHETIIGTALSANFGGRSIVVDCMPSAGRLVWAHDAVPCILPKHEMYHVGLERYLEAEDFLNAQGLWRCCWSEDAWESLRTDTAFARDLASNSFSSTVNQAMLLTTMVTCTDAWMAIQKSHDCVGPNAAAEPHCVLRRLRKKRKAPEYVPPPGPPPPMRPAKSKRRVANGRRRRGEYTRVVKGVDSRKNSNDKRPVSTIWQKEKVCLAEFCLCLDNFAGILSIYYMCAIGLLIHILGCWFRG